MVKHWLHHASKATEEIAEELSAEEEFWKPGSLIRRRWLIEYARLNPPAFEDLDLDRNLSALHVAASVGFSQLVVALIKHGHDSELSLRDANDDTPVCNSRIPVEAEADSHAVAFGCSFWTSQHCRGTAQHGLRN
jgi:hypothetical protein